MAFITAKKEKTQVKIKNFGDFYKDAINKKISIFPFDIYEYANSFYSIESIDDDLKFPIIGLIEVVQDSNQYGFVITLNKYHDIAKRRTILAKLFAHYCLHRDYIIENKKIEIQNFWEADKMNQDALNFASKLLMPKATFITIARECRTFGELAERFKVTPKMAKFRFNNVYE